MHLRRPTSLLATVILLVSGTAAAPALTATAAAALDEPVVSVDVPGEITGGDPLSLIRITPDLNCDVRHVDDEYPEFYDGTAAAPWWPSTERCSGPSTSRPGVTPIRVPASHR